MGIIKKLGGLNMKMSTEEMIREISKNAKIALEQAKLDNENKNQVVGAVDKKIHLTEEGSYFAILKDAKSLENIPAKYGLADAIDLELELYLVNEKYSSMETTTVKERLFKSPNAYSPYYRHLKEILGKDPRDGFNTSELVGKVLEVDIIHNQTKKRAYANVGDIRVLDVENIEEVL